MDENIKVCVQSRTDFFEKYCDVPPQAQTDVDAFILAVTDLGEMATDAMDFEAKFANGGYQERFNELVTRCTPKAYTMTAEDKAYSKQVAKEIFKEDRSRIMKESAEDIVDHASVALEEEWIAQRRRVMVDAGVYDEYTRATNVMDMAADAGGFLKGLFKKKK